MRSIRPIAWSHALATRLLARVGLILWLPAVALGAGSLMVGHWVPLPKPSTQEPLLVEGLGELAAQIPLEPGRWTLTHFLYANCACSRRVANYLLESERDVDFQELIVLIGEDSELLEQAAGSEFSFVHLSAEEVELRTGITSAPLFAVSDSGGQVLYAGGYTERKQGFAYRDLSIARTLKSGQVAPSLPVYGCGVSTSLRESLDPLGLKRATQRLGP